MNRALFSRLMNLRRLFAQQSKRQGSGGHHDVVNPGPPVTYDYAPVPFQPYMKVHNELQAKFNRYLVISTAFLVFSFSLAIYNDIFIYEALSRPKSYRNRHKN